MKKILITFFACFACLAVMGQMVGQFNYGNDGRLYLFLQNTTNYTLTFTGAVYSPTVNTGNSETCSVPPGQGIYLGPTTPWRWQWRKGDVYTITYPNGYVQSWTSPITDVKQYNPSFKGRYHLEDKNKKCYNRSTHFEVYKDDYRIVLSDRCSNCGAQYRNH